MNTELQQWPEEAVHGCRWVRKRRNKKKKHVLTSRTCFLSVWFTQKLTRLFQIHAASVSEQRVCVCMNNWTSTLTFNNLRARAPTVSGLRKTDTRMGVCKLHNWGNIYRCPNIYTAGSPTASWTHTLTATLTQSKIAGRKASPRPPPTHSTKQKKQSMLDQSNWVWNICLGGI